MIQTDAAGGHNWTAPRFDALGIFYVTFASFYSSFVAYGLYRLFTLRNTPAVRLRSFPVICSTVLALHLYIVAILLVYPLNGAFKCGSEFWIMSTVLPLSMALFQASNIRLLSYYEEQQELVDPNFVSERQSRLRNPLCSLKARWKRLNCTQKTYIGILVGGLCQLIVTLLLFFGSYRFHGSYGFFSNHVDAASCRRGFEWAPSVFWQFLWSTVFGPYVLLRTRHIFDAHYWAKQTRLAIVACLPGTPLWLAFVYSENATLAMISDRFVPAGWFLPGLFMMQFVCIFFPLYDATKMKNLQKKLEAASNGSVESSSAAERKRTYSLASLDYQIAHNIEPLLRWSAQKEFTAENIVFIREVRDFKKKWSTIAKRGNLTNTQQRERYEEAAVIYFTLINPLTARFNINIDHKTYMDLQALFSGLKYEPFDDSDTASTKSSAKSDNVVAPWADFESVTAFAPQTDDAIADHTLDKLYPLPVTEIRSSDEMIHPEVRSCHSYSNCQIPSAFTVECFDKAYDIVRRDVYVNTWSKYEARFSRPHGRGGDAGKVGSRSNLAAFIKRASNTA